MWIKVIKNEPAYDSGRAHLQISSSFSIPSYNLDFLFNNN